MGAQCVLAGLLWCYLGGDRRAYNTSPRSCGPLTGSRLGIHQIVVVYGFLSCVKGMRCTPELHVDTAVVL